MMKTCVEKLTHLKQFPNWDILLDIAAQFCGCRHEIYSIGETHVNTNQGVKNANEHLDLIRELAGNNVLTRSMGSSSLAPCNPKVNTPTQCTEPFILFIEWTVRLIRNMMKSTWQPLRSLISIFQQSNT